MQLQTPDSLQGKSRVNQGVKTFNEYVFKVNIGPGHK